MLHDVPLDVVEVMTEARRHVRPIADASSHTVDIRHPESLPCLRADHRALLQILINLLSNAIKFSKPNTIITMTVDIADDGAMKLTVSDEGIGMADADIRRALQPYEQIDSSIAGGQRGTGLGLHLCTRLMSLHGGVLSVESAPGLGTTITLNFPSRRVGPPPTA